MVPGDIYKDLVSYGIPIIAIGDHGQLPPVKGEFNLMEHPDLALQQIHRNANGIAKTAEVIRHGGLVPFGEVNENVLKLDTRLWRGWADAPEEVKEAVFNPSPDKLFITAKNKNRVDANTSIRGNLLETSMMSAVEAIGPQPNDRVICVRNNWNLGIHNGMLGTIKAIEHKADDIWHIEFLPDGEYLSDEFDITDYFFNKEQYREPLDHVIGNGLGRFDYGYCITCHKAQGSEAKIVAVFGQGFGSPDLKRRWMYTAVTRAKDRCLILYH